MTRKAIHQILLGAGMLLACATEHGLHAQTVRWATRVADFSSQYMDKDKSANWNAIKVLGAPSVLPAAGTTSQAWSPATESSGEEYIIVGFDNPAPAQQVIINDNSKPKGYITEVVIYDEKGKGYSVYNNVGGMDTLRTTQLNVFFPRTAYNVAGVKVVLDTRSVKGWNHIDAIGLADTQDTVHLRINLPRDMAFTEEKPENLGAGVNSKYEELAPVISTDGKTIYFVRGGHPMNMDQQSAWFANLRENGNWGEAAMLPSPINYKGNAAVLGTLPDGNTLLLSGKYVKNSKSAYGISLAQRDSSGWAFPQGLEIHDFLNDVSASESCLAPNGKVLIQTADRGSDAKSGNLGMKDMYVSFLNEDGTWSAPLNMGSVVNSEGNEVSPFIAADGVTLYFSTNGFMGYGGNDLYMSRRLDDSWTNWTIPVNMGPNINGSGFDAYCTIPAKGDYLYFVASNGDNSTDIYRVALPQVLQPQPVALIKGRVLNAKTREPMAATIRYELLAEGREVGTAISALPEGKYRISLPAGHQYGFRAEATGFIPVSENLELKSLGLYSEVERDLLLAPIEVGQTIRLNNIFFATGSHLLQQESFAELNRLVDILNKNPGMHIEIGGHTDNTGTPAINQPLSQNRAQAVYKYLADKGIAAARLTVKGYAATKPVADNNTDNGRLFNRRVEFTIHAK